MKRTGRIMDVGNGGQRRASFFPPFFLFWLVSVYLIVCVFVCVCVCLVCVLAFLSSDEISTQHQDEARSPYPSVLF